MSSDHIRPYSVADEAATARVWYESGRAEYSYLPDFQSLTPKTALGVFRGVIVPGGNLWVVDAGGAIRAFMSLRGSYVDRLYVSPGLQRDGWGSALLARAKVLMPAGLSLHTHQVNIRARRFYERHGFVAVRFGMSPAPERVPDVEYCWRP